MTPPCAPGYPSAYARHRVDRPPTSRERPESDRSRVTRIKTHATVGTWAPGARRCTPGGQGEVNAVTTRAQTWITRTMILGALLVALRSEPRGPGAAARPSPKRNLGTQVNVELIMDSSGSMAAATDTGEPRIDAAKRVLNQVIDAIPVDRPETQRRLPRVRTPRRQHRGGQGRELSVVRTDGAGRRRRSRRPCASRSPTTQPVGWTPIGLSLERAAADFPAASDTVTNAIILVTDGLETCDADPCAIATALKESEAAITVYVVGLGLDEEELRITSCIAENTGGQIVGAQNADELSVALFTFLEELEVVITTGFLEIESIGGLYPLATLTCAEQPATDSNPQGGEPFTYTFTADTNKVEVPIGVCDLAWTNPSGNETTIRVNIEADRTTFVRGSLIKFPQGAGEIYILKAQDGTVIWQDQIEQGDWVWVLPGIYTLRPARTGRRPNPDLVHRADLAGLGNPGRDLHRAIAATSVRQFSLAVSVGGPGPAFGRARHRLLMLSWVASPATRSSRRGRGIWRVMTMHVVLLGLMGAGKTSGRSGRRGTSGPRAGRRR